MEKSLEELIKELEQNGSMSEQDIEESMKYIEEYEKANSTKNTEISLSYEQVGEFLNSREFVELISKYKFRDINHIRAITNKLIGIAMDYTDIFRNSGTSSIDELKEILRGVVKRDIKKERYDIIEVYENKLKRDLGLHKKEDLSQEEDMLIKEKIINILAFKQTKFHAFNGAFLSSIKENGINPNTKTSDSVKHELDKLHKKYGLFYKESIKADAGHVSYSATASVSYNYAITSPEWFNNMCSTYFASRNYEGAKQEFERTSGVFSPEDKKRYIELFEQCWNEYSGNKTYLAIVPDVIVHDYDDLLLIRYKFLDCDSSFAFRVLADAMREKGCNVNDRTNSRIDTTNASFIELPDLKDLAKKIEQIQALQQEEGVTN